MTPLFQWGGKAQNAVVGGARNLFSGNNNNNNEEGYVEKTKRFAKDSWTSLRNKFNDVRQSVSERFQSKQ